MNLGFILINNTEVIQVCGEETNNVTLKNLKFGTVDILPLHLPKSHDMENILKPQIRWRLS